MRGSDVGRLGQSELELELLALDSEPDELDELDAPEELDELELDDVDPELDVLSDPELDDPPFEELERLSFL